MTDKVQKIREEVERLQNELIQEKEKGFGSDVDDACILELQNVLTYIDSLQEEPVSNDLKEASRNYADKEKFRKEVEKLKSNLMHGACSSQIAMETRCKEEAYNEVLAILDTMQEKSKQCMYSKDHYTDEDRKVLCDGCEEECEYNKKEEPVSEDLELTWEDIPKIFQISEELKTSWWFRDNEQTKLIGTQIFWEEVLRRFNKQRKEN